MHTVKEAASTFLNLERIAVTGVSRTPQSHGGNIVYRRLKERGYDVFPVNPNADEVEGDRCYHDLKSIPADLQGVVIATRPEAADSTVQECIELGIGHVWMHRAFGAGSVSPSAAATARRHGIEVIDGGCPLMFGPAADGGHALLRFVCTLTGKVPRRV